MDTKFGSWEWCVQNRIQPQIAADEEIRKRSLDGNGWISTNGILELEISADYTDYADFDLRSG
jgi:hypothetical protein